jgi:hypothetical protein
MEPAEAAEEATCTPSTAEVIFEQIDRERVMEETQ